MRFSTVVAACGPVLGAKLAWCTDARQLRDKYGAAAGEARITRGPEEGEKHKLNGTVLTLYFSYN